MNVSQATVAPRPNTGFWRALPLAIGISSALWGMGFAIAEVIAHQV